MISNPVMSSVTSSLPPVQSILTNLMPYLRLRIINNDTYEEYPSFLGCSPPRYIIDIVCECYLFSILKRRYIPNQLGYTVMAECKCPFRVAGSRCRLRVISTNVKFSVENEPLRYAHESEDAYSPTQIVPLFRDVLRVKERAQVAIHVGVPPGNGNVYIKLQVISCDVILYYLLFLCRCLTRGKKFMQQKGKNVSQYQFCI